MSYVTDEIFWDHEFEPMVKAVPWDREKNKVRQTPLDMITDIHRVKEMLEVDYDKISNIRPVRKEYSLNLSQGKRTSTRKSKKKSRKTVVSPRGRSISEKEEEEEGDDGIPVLLEMKTAERDGGKVDTERSGDERKIEETIRNLMTEE